jgi:ERCC4-related helicase
MHVIFVVPVAPRHLELRGYQQELASDGLGGNNCLIVAPTGSGKTLIALAIAKVFIMTQLAKCVVLLR